MTDIVYEAILKSLKEIGLENIRKGPFFGLGTKH